MFVAQSSSAHPHQKRLENVKCIVLGGANAGKTSILRKYFHGNFDPSRRPTVGSDFYSKKLTIAGQGKDENDDNHNDNAERRLDGEEKKEPHLFMPISEDGDAVLSMQIWDTPGRERFAANQTKPMYTAAFSDNFFRNADAALLVYDITSSTSFTHVLKWYEDLMLRIRRLEANGQRTRPFPVLVVANKLDILRCRDEHLARQHPSVDQRDVMGILGKNFRGKDSHYEYTVSTVQPESGTNPSPTGKQIPVQSDQRPRHEISTYMGTGHQTNYLQSVLNNDVQIGSYLESLLSTEDLSHPDIDMVRLWCMRNGLQHLEVSALDGTGVEELIGEMLSSVLKARQAPTCQLPQSSEPPEASQEFIYRNRELDLHRRYGSDSHPCFSLLSWCFPGTKSNSTSGRDDIWYDRRS
eukprot:Nitzschia sp. Nitz4//scaffold283_size24287//13117//14346//NITZ4_008405-RA/size24287-processed-gene-0.7-mRNA-1//-1//CDS//3329545654//5294//frame0